MPLGSWQNLVWQKPYTDNLFFQMCKALESASEARALDAYASFTNRTIASICPDPSQQDYCFGTFDAKQYVQDGLEETWRLWSWQFCTEWGYCEFPAGLTGMVE